MTEWIIPKLEKHYIKAGVLKEHYFINNINYEKKYNKIQHFEFTDYSEPS